MMVTVRMIGGPLNLLTREVPAATRKIEVPTVHEGYFCPLWGYNVIAQPVVSWPSGEPRIEYFGISTGFSQR